MPDLDVMDAPASAPSSLEGEITAALEGTSEAPSEYAWDEPEPDFGGEEEAAVAQDEPAVAPVAEGTAQAAPEPPGEGAQETAPADYATTQDGNSYIVPKTDLGEYRVAREYADAVRQHFATPQDAADAFTTRTNASQMILDYLHNGDEGTQNFLSHWAGMDYNDDPALAAQHAEAFSRMALQMPSFLKQVNEGAFGQMEAGILQPRIDALYQAAVESGNPSDLYAAQRLDYEVNGRYLQSIDQVKVEDAAARQARELQERTQAIEQREEALASQSWGSYVASNVDGPKWSELNAEISRALEPLKGSFRPEQMARLHKEVRDEIIATVTKDALWARNHLADRNWIENQYKQAFKQHRNPDMTPQIQRYRTDFLSRTRPLVGPIARRVTEGATATAVAASAAQPAQARPRQATPVQSAQPQQRPAAAKQEWDLDREIRNALRGAA